MKCDKLKTIFATPHPKMKNPCDGAIEVYGKAEVDKVLAEKDAAIKELKKELKYYRDFENWEDI